MKPVTGKVLKSVMFLVLAVIVLVVFVLFRQSKQFNIAAAFLAHTNEVLYHNQKLLTALSRNESALQNISENVDPASALKMKNADSVITAESEKIKTLTADNRVQVPRTDSLIKLVTANNALANEIYNQNQTAQVPIAKLTDAKERIATIRRIAAEIEHEEIGLLTQRKQVREDLEEGIMKALLWLIVIILILIVLIIRSVRIDFLALKKTEKERDEKNEQFRLLIENVNEYAFFFIDTNGNVLNWNKGAEIIEGYKAEEIIGKNISVFYTTDAIKNKELETNLKKAAEAGRFETESLHVRKDGSTFWAEVVFTCLYDDSHRLNGFLKIIKDITEQKKKQEEITYLSGLVEKTNDAIFSVDTTSTIKSWNKAAEKMYGYNHEEAIGKNISELLQSRISEEDRKNAIEELNEKGYYHSEFEYTTKYKESIFVLSTVSTLYDNDHKVNGYVTIHRDITIRKNLEDQLKKFNEELEEKVKDKTSELTEVFERITDAFIALDKNWCYTYLNKATGELIHRDPGSMIGKNVWKEFPDVVGSPTYMIFQQAMKEQKYMHNEDYYEPFDLWQENHVYPSPQGISVFIKNITERKKAEQEIIKEKNLSDSIINSLPGAFYLYNMEGKFFRWNKNFEKVTMYNSDEISKMHPLDFFDVDEKDYLRSRIGQVFVNGVSDAEANFLTKDNRKIPYYFTGIKLEYQGQPCLLGVGIDISSRVEAQKKIRQTSEQLRELAAHLQDVREEERASIAREIHDELGQQLTGLKMDVYWLRDELKPAEESAGKQIENILQLLDTAINTVRKISSELRPPMIDDIGLIESLKWYAKEFQKRFNIKVMFNTSMDSVHLSPKQSIALFRIFQESLTNVARHAQAKKVSASLLYENNLLILRVADDGKGFDNTQTAKKKTLGLLGMKERILMINGNFEINSNPGAGTEVIATVHTNAGAEIIL
ncbi:MAG: PAS domain S-box protein [Bacteroidetes bacterium]|nr:PAS domain S-box protein [Bacteroidota bacterium]